MPGFVMYKGEMTAIDTVEQWIAQGIVKREDVYVQAKETAEEAKAEAPGEVPEKELPGKPEQTGDSDDSGDSDGLVDDVG